MVTRILRQNPLNRGTLKRKSGRNTIHFSADSGNIELRPRTIHSSNQLSINGAESSWCTDLAEKMHDQTSTGVNRSISEENDQLAPQEVGSLVRNQPRHTGSPGKLLARSFATIRHDEILMNNFAPYVKKQDSSVSEGMYYRIGEDVSDGFGT